MKSLKQLHTLAMVFIIQIFCVEVITVIKFDVSVSGREK